MPGWGRAVCPWEAPDGYGDRFARATGLPSTMACDYRVADGINQTAARERIATTRDKLTEYYGRSRDLYRLRDHLLFLASAQRLSGGTV